MASGTSLRRHHPDQVRTVGVSAPSQPARGSRWSPSILEAGRARDRAAGRITHLGCAAWNPLPAASGSPPRASTSSATPASTRSSSTRCSARRSPAAPTSCSCATSMRRSAPCGPPRALFREAAAEHGALFFLNDRPDLAAEVGADGVHVGQDDMDVARPAQPRRRRCARWPLQPRARPSSTRRWPPTGDSAPRLHQHRSRLGDADQGGPAGRGARLRRLRGRAAPRGRAGSTPWFAIGSIDAGNLAEVRGAGARRIVVVRAIRDAREPLEAARELRGARWRREAARDEQPRAQAGRPPEAQAAQRLPDRSGAGATEATGAGLPGGSPRSVGDRHRRRGRGARRQQIARSATSAPAPRWSRWKRASDRASSRSARCSRPRSRWSRSAPGSPAPRSTASGRASSRCSLRRSSSR